MLHTMKGFQGETEIASSDLAVPLSVIIGGRAIADQASGSDFGALDQMGTKRRFAKSETIFSEGDEAAFSYRVVSGAIRLCKYFADGRRQIADFILPGDICGFLHLKEHRFTAEAASDVVVICYPQRQIEAMAERTPGMRKSLNHFVTTRLMEVQDHLIMLGCQTAKEKVVSFLLILANRASAEDGDSVDLPMSRRDVADYLGLTVETVCRVLADLKRTRLVAVPKRDKIMLTNISRLREVGECQSDCLH